MKKYLSYFIFLILLSSCEKELDFKYHEIEPQLVIEGSISELGSQVKLTLTTPMSESIDTTSLTDAEVTLKDISNSSSIILFPDKNGIYFSDFKGIIGHQYQLEIRRNEKEYISTSMMLGAVEIINLEFQWIKMPYDRVAVLGITFFDSDSADDCYWLKIYKNNAPYMWLLSDDRSAVNGVIHEVTMTSRENPDDYNDPDVLRKGDVVKVVICPVSRKMYDYLTAIQSDSNGPKMFSGDFCLGYFITSETTESSIIFNPDSITEYK